MKGPTRVITAQRPERVVTDPPPFAADLLPTPLQVLMAYDANKATAKLTELEETIHEMVVTEEEVNNELKKLDGARRFVWERLLKKDEERDMDLFKSKD